MTEFNEHKKDILDQFTKQAVPFAERLAYSNEESTSLLIKMSSMGKNDAILDVACGPGLLSCALAPYVKKVMGIDLVPAMIEKAQKSQQEKNLSNIDWKIGDILPLPFADSSFSIVVCRYAFHHFLKPEAVLKEMIRVTEPRGKVAVIDVFTSSATQSNAYDKVEKLKDPSHVRTLPLTELQEMVFKTGLVNAKAEFYKIEMKLEDNLKASFPKEKGDIDKIRQAIIDDIEKDRIGMGACRKEEDVYLNYPIVAIVAEKP
ncbi:MAG TPA: class I SAM-dependent methyltransferase [Patescibacteria group bacterium]|nr:class I SAM-dependent methyltransferase [Patescibacteria group bacterium]